MSQEFKVTKTWLQEEFAKGALVSTVLEKVNSTLPEGSKLSEGKFKQGLKQLKINLRTKPRPMAVTFVDDTNLQVQAPQNIENSTEGEVVNVVVSEETV